jgi:hypothetical protein
VSERNLDYSVLSSFWYSGHRIHEPADKITSFFAFTLYGVELYTNDTPVAVKFPLVDFLNSILVARAPVNTTKLGRWALYA